MRKIRGFKIWRKLRCVSGWILRRARIKTGYHRLAPTQRSSSTCKVKPITKLLNWGRRLIAAKPGSGYLPVGQDPVPEKPVHVPKGHLAVYVGQKDGDGGDFHRVLVPVIYINHPLFSELLREAEEEYGFSQQGGITIPCGLSEFEQVQTRIAATGSGCSSGRMTTWKRNNHHHHHHYHHHHHHHRLLV